MYKISIYGCAMFKKLVCQWVNNVKLKYLRVTLALLLSNNSSNTSDV